VSQRTMNRLRRSVLTLGVIASVLGVTRADASAQESTSTEGALFLLLPIGAKGVSMGRAMTAMDGVESGFWNPAGLAGVDQRQVVLFRGDNVAGTGTAVSVILAHSSLGTLSASYFLHDVGSQDLTDFDGNFLGTLTVRNHLGVVTAATRILDRVNAGVSFKLVQFQTACRGTFCPDVGTTARSYAMDAGLQMSLSESFRIAAMVAHVGPALQVLNAEQADPLPARVRVAVAYDLVSALTEDEELGGWLSVEVEDRLLDPGHLSLYVGSELTAGRADALFLRAGYVVGDDDRDGARVGLGLRYESFDLAIAKSLATSAFSESEPVHVTFAIRF
jgi:hypothetical protein